VTVTSTLRPGFKAEIQAEILSTSKRDSLGLARMFIDGKPVASLNRIIYSHFHNVNTQELIRRFEYYSGLKVD
jgi:3-hydroxyacyl-[acyl-carrier-protein] dehydratase